MHHFGEAGKSSAILGSILLLTSLTAPGAPRPRLVEDIAQDPKFTPFTFEVMEDVIYFNPPNLASGIELWKSDGTKEGTRLLKDINPGVEGSNPSLHRVGNQLFLKAYAPTSYSELYRSDGTAVGTVLVADIAPLDSSSPRDFTSLGDKAVFTADDKIHGRELWISDGTAAGTILVKDIQPGWKDAAIESITVAGTNAYFNAKSNAISQLWRSDGTGAGTVLLQSSGFTGARALTSVGDTLYFTAYATANRPEVGLTLWKTDGSVAGTVEVSTEILSRNNHVPSITATDGWVYYSSGGNTSGMEIWKTNGIAAPSKVISGLKGVRDLEGLPALAGSGPALYFLGRDDAHGWEFWKSDGTSSGTKLLADLAPGPQDSYWRNPVVSDGYVFFRADSGQAGRQLWKSDGTTAGTAMIKQFIDEPSGFKKFKGGIAFMADNGGGRELWITDGSVAGTEEITDVIGTDDSNPEFRTAFGDALSFKAGGRAWLTNGTDTWENTAPGAVTSFGGMKIHSPSLGDIQVYAGSGNTSDIELWRTDGTLAGTQLVTGLRANGSSSPSYFMSGGTFVTFFATDGVGWKLWRSDGTDSGTFPLMDVASLPAGTGTLNAISNGSRIYFTLTNGGGADLWKTDGTELGTTLVRHMNYPVTALGDAGNRIYFKSNGYIWRSDGTEAGTVQIDTGEHGLQPPAGNGDLFYFTKMDFNGRTALWRTNGTLSGTAFITSVPGLRNSKPVSSTVGGRMVFWTYENERYSLWSSDGTATGTQLVHTTHPTSHIYKQFTKDGDFYFLSGTTEAPDGLSLWKSDGTPGNTARVLLDLSDYWQYSGDLAVAGNNLYLPLDSDSFGKELYVIGFDQLKTGYDNYLGWIETSDLDEPETSPLSSPFGDGVPNLLKYAFFLNPSGPDSRCLIPATGIEGLPAYSLESQTDGSVFRMEFVRRKDAGLNYTPIISTTLQADSFQPMTGRTFVTDIDAERERVIVEMPVDPSVTPKCFGAVNVSWE